MEDVTATERMWLIYKLGIVNARARKEASMQAQLSERSTGAMFRYSVMRNGKSCCQSNDLDLLCSSCRAEVQAAAATNVVPEAPDLTQRILTARGTASEGCTSPALNVHGVPEPIDLATRIREVRRKR
jgi:hypothetical protein